MCPKQKLSLQLSFCVHPHTLNVLCVDCIVVWIHKVLLVNNCVMHINAIFQGIQVRIGPSPIWYNMAAWKNVLCDDRFKCFRGAVSDFSHKASPRGSFNSPKTQWSALKWPMCYLWWRNLLSSTSATTAWPSSSKPPISMGFSRNQFAHSSLQKLNQSTDVFLLISAFVIATFWGRSVAQWWIVNTIC